MDKYKSAMAFISGLVIGVVASEEFFKRKYSKQYEEDSASVKAEYARLKSKIQKANQGATDSPLNDEKASQVLAYAEAIRPYVSSDENDRPGTSYCSPRELAVDGEDEETEREDNFDGPVLISPDEYGERIHYNQVTFTYYADNVLVDELDEPVINLEEVIGGDALTQFGNDDIGYGDDAVYVRNDRLRCEYEIIRDPRLYADVVKTKPRKVEV